MAICNAEYIWLDGCFPTPGLRSKTRVLDVSDEPSIEDFPIWGFDGSSTNQSAGDDSDCLLQPVNVVVDPVRGDGNFLVMCEVFNSDGTAHKTNTRALLRTVLEAGADKEEPWIGFEQEYVMYEGDRLLGWPSNGFPAPQGPYYCGVGDNRVKGRELVECHMQACMDAGIMIYGVNAEVMLSQWEFQIGYRGVADEDSGVLNVSDHVWLARWLLCRLGEDFGISISFDNKPMKGDWNGSGMHTNFSTVAIRDENSGMNAIKAAIQKLANNHEKHVVLYGHALEERLTGAHETCSINEFKAGVADRGASIRIPQSVSLEGCGYLEDRRPGANADPYLVAARLCATICDVDEENLEGVYEDEEEMTVVV